MGSPFGFGRLYCDLDQETSSPQSTEQFESTGQFACLGIGRGRVALELVTNRRAERFLAPQFGRAAPRRQRALSASCADLDRPGRGPFGSRLRAVHRAWSTPARNVAAARLRRSFGNGSRGRPDRAGSGTRPDRGPRIRSEGGWRGRIHAGTRFVVACFRDRCPGSTARGRDPRARNTPS